MQLQHGRVQGIAHLVSETEGERAHRRKCLGISGTALESAALGYVDADTVDQVELSARVANARKMPANTPQTTFAIEKPRFDFHARPTGKSRLIGVACLGDGLREAVAIVGRHEALTEGLVDGRRGGKRGEV